MGLPVKPTSQSRKSINLFLLAHGIEGTQSMCQKIFLFSLSLHLHNKDSSQQYSAFITLNQNKIKNKILSVSLFTDAGQSQQLQ